jgi:stage IV sporulation protein A
MESMVLPNIKEGYERNRARDELPQSAGGRTVMTTEPKFIPDNAVTVEMSEGETMRVKMIDCVGYIVPDALGTLEEGQPRMVRTPWQTDPMPFVEAAELGTKKVINEHSTIGMLISTDGSIGEIPRESYVSAEERVVNELKAIGKPFAMILNSANPQDPKSIALAYELEEKYSAPVALVNCLELDSEDIKNILEMVLCEFPVTEIKVKLPAWMQAIDEAHPVRKSISDSICKCAQKIEKVGEIKNAFTSLSDNEFISSFTFDCIDYGCGGAKMSVFCSDELYFKVLSELTGFEIDGEEQLVYLLKEYSLKKSELDRIAEALRDAEEKGYGIVMPDASALSLEEPEIVKRQGAYGVKLRASAQSIHMIRANIETEINPIVGSEAQSEDLVKYLLEEFEEDPRKIWDSNMFGKSLYELMNEGLHTKLDHIPEQSRNKLSETLERIINEGSSGLICIIL